MVLNKKREVSMKQIKKVLIILLLLVTLLGVPIIARNITNLFDFSKIDPDKAFMWFMVRHTIQALIIGLIMLILIKVYKIDFKLSLGDSAVGVSYLKKFMIIFSIGCIAYYLIFFFLGQNEKFAYDLTFKNIVGYLSFQLFFTGPSEEFIFRAFSITVFSCFVSKMRLNKKISYANLFAAIVFGLAHLYITFSPFKVTFLLPQVIISIILGYFYGDCYEKSNSIVYPIIMHSFTNIMMVGLQILLTALS